MSMKQKVQLINRPIYTKKNLCRYNEMCDKDGISKQRGQNRLWCFENSLPPWRKTRYSFLPYTKCKTTLHKDKRQGNVIPLSEENVHEYLCISQQQR